jgi:hypothetical protein
VVIFRIPPLEKLKAVEKPAKVRVVRLVTESQALGVVDIHGEFSREKPVMKRFA